MRVVVYSTNANRFDGGQYELTCFPSRAHEWEAVAARWPEHRFVLATQLPGSFLLDLSGNEIGEKAPSVEYVILKGRNPAALADEIARLAPDLAVAFSFWEPPFDWLPLADSMIGERLRERGIRTLASPPSAQLRCFDKAETSRFLKSRGFACANCVHVKRELYWGERGNSAIESNVYKEYVFRELEKLRYPVIVKPAYGLSSYSMLKAFSPRQVVACLNSGKSKTDSLVEEYLEGIQAGAEIYGRKGAYTVLPPFLFSTDRWGITSPKQGIKLGPVLSAGLQEAGGGEGRPLQKSLGALERTLVRLAEELGIDGVAQVDLVFSGGSWYVIEVNPRLSGLSDTDAVSSGKLPIERLLAAALGADGGACRPALPVCNFKIPIMPAADLKKIASLPYIRAVRQLENKAVRQKREVGYSEIIIAGEGGVAGIGGHLEELERLFPGSVDATFRVKLKEMSDLLALG